jgi:hypothetical protein
MRLVAMQCATVRLYFDGNHLSLAGSALVVLPLAEAVLAALMPGD